jgi:hypothetical protein
MPSIPDYPPAVQPLDGSELVPIWQNGKQVSSQARKLTDAVSGAIIADIAAAQVAVEEGAATVASAVAATGADRTQTGLDAAATAADRLQTGIDRSATSALASNAVAVSLAAGPYANAYTSTLPRGVTGTTGLTGGSGGTNGTFALGFSGGSITGMAGTFTVAGGAVTSITITNSGLGTGTTPPTLSFTASGGLTGASATAVVGPLISQTKTYWAVSLDSLFEQLWTNDGTSTPAPVLGPDGQQIRFMIKPAMQFFSGLAQYGSNPKPIRQVFVAPNGEVSLVIFSDRTIDHGEFDPASDAWLQITKLLSDTIATSGFGRQSGLGQITSVSGRGSPVTARGVKWVVCTPDGTPAFAVLDNGQVWFGEYDDRLLAAVQAVEGPAMSRDGVAYYELNGQIAAYYGNTPVVLTSDGVNDCPRPIGTGVEFRSFRNRGLPAPYVMNFDGSDQRAKILNDAVYEVYLFLGQSQTPGYIASPALSTTPPYRGQALMLTGLVGPIAAYPVTMDPAATLIDCCEVTAESCGTAFAAALLDRELASRPDLKVVVCGTGDPATAYTGIKKGTGPYADAMAQLARVNALGLAEIAAGRAPGKARGAILRGVVLLHGENDAQNANYRDNLVEFRTDVQADARTITGQHEEVPFLLTQMAALRFIDPNPGSTLKNKSVLAQLAVSQETGSRHYLEEGCYANECIDYAHWQNTARRREGEKLGATMHRVIHLGGDHQAIAPKPLSEWTISGNTIVIPWLTSGYPLALDTTLVTDPGNYGFSLKDSVGTTITHVAVTGDAEITLTLSAPFGANAVIDCGYSNGGDGTHGGPTSGARTCVRDTNPAVSRFDNSIHLYRWSAIWRQPLN